MTTKVHISLPIKEGAYGGSHRFLGSLRTYLRKSGVYAELAEDADVILFSASQYIPETARLKLRHPQKLFVHRIDGPIRLYHVRGDKRDLLINTANKLIADGTVFQTEWSKKKNKEMGLEPTSFETTITNASDRNTFFPKSSKQSNEKEKIKLLASSWSSFRKKGFSVYEWLDKNLDFSKYELTFIGNSPIKFSNIKMVGPLGPDELAGVLRNHDVFITASENDPCSNSVVEALSCGLPVLALKSGGHPELVKDGGVLFSGTGDILEKLDSLVENYPNHKEKIDVPDINEAGDLYHSFLTSVHQAQSEKNYQPKRLTFLGRARLRFVMIMWIVWRNWYKLIKQYEKINKKFVSQ